MLLNDDGLVLTFIQAGEVTYLQTFYIGFRQENEERVNAIEQRLRGDGVTVDPPQRTHAWTSYVHAPRGLLVEVMS